MTAHRPGAVGGQLAEGIEHRCRRPGVVVEQGRLVAPADQGVLPGGDRQTAPVVCGGPDALWGDRPSLVDR
ncbi:hypothetical protein ACIGXI_10445 [Kitasatospora aureofaciens]|uniref:hypothetical protein n=1 Tax=Kitasatospora aureofaciens TaxID=1894 RepID=UPI0037CA688A